MIRIKHYIEFDFKNREASDLVKLNKVLNTMNLETVELKEYKGYLAVTQDGNDNLLDKRFGLDRGKLEFEPSEKGDRYQIDTAVADKSVDYDAFLEIWRGARPNRVVRTVITLEYENDYAYIILHHRKN